MSPATPQIIGRYALYDAIASGGMATVHYGRLLGEVGFSRAVAIKRLHAQFARDPEFSSMFIDEARLAARVQHPNVVQTLDVVAIEGEIFLVMEYVAGEPLVRLIRASIAKSEPLPLDIVSGIFCGALHGLHAAHEAKDSQGIALGIVHRDVSPQNVLVGADGVPRVLDFGVAKAAGRVQETREGQLKGKLAYMSPEQIRSLPVDRRTDLYATAVVLWETLTLQRLFVGETEGAVLQRVLTATPSPPSKLAPHVPPSLDAIVTRALAHDAACRFQTAREMADALEAAIPPASARRISGWVDRLVGEVLAQRARRVAELESGSGAKGAGVDQVATLVTPPRAPSARGASPSRRTRAVAVAVALVCVAAVVAVALRAAWHGGRPVTLTDLPMPSSSHPAPALAIYREAMQSLRDGNSHDEQLLEDAVKADPTLAGAHLRLSLRTMVHAPVDARLHYARAQALRDSLSDHDRVLLDAIEPYAQRDPADFAELARRARAAHERFPLDLEFAMLLVLAEDGYSPVADQLRALDRVLEMDPKYGYAYYIRAYYEAYGGDFESVKRTSKACLDAVPSADRCLAWLAIVEMQTGPPEHVELDARRRLATDPLGGNTMLAEALLAEGRPFQTVQEAVEQYIQLSPGAANDGRYSLDVLAGDFVSAQHRAEEALAAVEGDMTRASHASATRRLLLLYREEGEDARAAALASDYLVRKDAWAPDPRREDYAIARDPTPYVVSVVVHAGKAPAAELSRARDAWLAQWKALVRPGYASFLWPHAYASTVESPEEAQEAVAAMGPFEPVPRFWPETFLGGDVGRTLFLAGRNAEALVWLREAAGSSLALAHPIEHTHAIEVYGEALERSGDREGACRAYGRVLEAGMAVGAG